MTHNPVHFLNNRIFQNIELDWNKKKGDIRTRGIVRFYLFTV